MAASCGSEERTKDSGGGAWQSMSAHGYSVSVHRTGAASVLADQVMGQGAIVWRMRGEIRQPAT